MSEKRMREERSESPDEPIRPFKSIPASKLQAFTVGIQKKTAYQRHKEEADLKKKQESEEAAKVYAEFVASFEEPKSYKLGTTNFIKSGTLQPRDTADDYDKPIAKTIFKPMPFVRASDSISTVNKTTANDNTDEDIDEQKASKFKESKTPKKRNLDTFLEEIKKGQEGRGRSDGKNGVYPKNTSGPDDTGSFDDGDPNTTNLYVGNINPTVTETGLCHEFGKYGPIASVKIMWPRTQEERDKGKNCGFVSFMSREDASQAIKHLDGKMLDGYTMRVGWGKAVPLPAQPFFVFDKVQETVKTGLPFNAQIDPGVGGVNSRPRAEVHVTKPSDIQVMRIIHRMVERVIKLGPVFELAIMEKEKDNPKFRFLFDNMSPEHIYYRWRLYSMLQGDTKSRWLDEPFQMFEGGPWWIPPELPLFDEDDLGPMFDTDDEMADQDNITKGTLGHIARQRLGVLLRKVTFQRGTIARTMAFAIDHADAASEIVDLLCKSILIPDSPLSVKLARLYLVSDILHNSSVHVSNAWKYRKEFESQLPMVFDHFNSIYRSINARLKAEQVRKHISAIITVWENWMIFPKYYTDQLSDIFLKKESKLPKASGNISYEQDTSMNEADEKGSYNGNASMADEFEESLDDVDGEPLDDVDGEPLDDVDGEPMDDVDGEPMEEDIGHSGNMNDMPLQNDGVIDDMFA